MKKLFTLLAIYFLAIYPICSIKAADVSLVETFGTMPNIYNSEESTSLSKQMETRSGKSSQGTLTVWQYRRVRAKKTDLLDGNRAFLMDRSCNANNSAIPYLQTATDSPWEGGIKSVQFDWKQVNNDDDGQLLKLQVILKDTKKVVSDITEEISVEAGETYRENTQSYTSSAIIDSKLNTVQLVLYNKSRNHDDNADAAGRILVGPITITPYLLFRNKEVTLGTKQRGFVNTNLINNTDGGTIRYYSSATDVATINSETGVVTPISAGNAVITAKWEEEDLTTTYILHVEDGIIVENFGKIAPTGPDAVTEPWDGDLFEWAVSKVRRDVNDTIGLNPRVQATWMKENAGYIQSSTDVEGGIKHIEFDWMQWSNVATTSVTVSYGGEDKVIDSKTDNTQFKHLTIDEDINCASNAVLKIANTSADSPNDRITIGAIKITPYLLYTNKNAEWDRTVDDGESFTNNDLIDNTDDHEIEYSISENEIEAAVDENGYVTSTGGGNVVFTAKWKEHSVETAYNLHIKAKTTAAFANPAVSVGLDGTVSNTLNKTLGYDGIISYSSDNTEVADVDESTGAVTLKGDVGVATITATLPATDDYDATTASYRIYITDNSARVETFEDVSQEELTNTEIDWNGKLFTWKVLQVRRNSTTDTIWSNPSKQGTWIRLHNGVRGYLKSKDVVEGGIKHLSFYWKQWATENEQTLRLSVFAGDEASDATRVKSMEEVPDTYGPYAPEHEKYLFGANNVMRNNQRVIIKNESYTGETFVENNAPSGTSVSRMIMDDIYITPWLLYTNKSVSIVNSGTYINEGLVNNTGGETGTLSYRSLNESVATVEKDGSGKCVVTPHQVGVATIEAKFDWGDGNYVTTTYQLHVVDALTWTEDYSNFPSRGMQESKITDKGVYLDWYYRYARSNPSKDKIDGNRGVWTNHYNRNTVTNKATYLGCETEGGIKHAYFKWKQATTDDNTDNLYLSVAIDGVEKYDSKVTASDAYVNTPQEFDEDFEVKTNADFRILNISTTARENPTDIGRMIIGPVTITPYLFYLEREKTIESGVNYTHPMIDNMDGEGYVTYSLVNPTSEGIATIDEKTGEVTAISQGTVTVKATWSEGAFTTYTLHIVDVILNDEGNNAETIDAHDGQTVDVQLADRTIRTGGYNTLCLPFAMSEEQLAESPLAGGKVYNFTNAYLGTENLDIRFEKVNSMEAGKPYLVTVPADVENPVFEGVTINNSTENNIATGANMRFIGSFNQETMNETGLYIVANSLYRVENITSWDKTIGACRAYFDVPAGAPAVAQGIRMRIVEEEVATGVEEAGSETVNTVRSEKKLIDGQLIIIRDGKEYNAQGMRIR